MKRDESWIPGRLEEDCFIGRNRQVDRVTSAKGSGLTQPTSESSWIPVIGPDGFKLSFSLSLSWVKVKLAGHRRTPQNIRKCENWKLRELPGTTQSWCPRLWLSHLLTVLSRFAIGMARTKPLWRGQGPADAMPVFQSCDRSCQIFSRLPPSGASKSLAGAGVQFLSRVCSSLLQFGIGIFFAPFLLIGVSGRLGVVFILRSSLCLEKFIFSPFRLPGLLLELPN